MSSHKHAHTFTLSHPDTSPFCQAAPELIRLYGLQESGEFPRSSEKTLSYAAGTIEGSLAFSLAVAMYPDSPDAAIQQCLSSLLLALGLDGEGLSLRDTRLRGWVVGMMGSIVEAVEIHIDANQQERGA